MSVGDGASGVSAGWYPDPADDARLRRWDGTGWTQDVILSPTETPGVVAPPAQPAGPTTLAPPNPQPSAPSYPQQAPSPQQAQSPQVPQPPMTPPPTAPGPPATPTPPPPAAMPTTVPNPSPAVQPTMSMGDRSRQNSGPITLPEWENLPGLTLPPDLSELDGDLEDTILHAPTFVPEPEPEQFKPDWKPQPTFVRPPFVEVEPEPVASVPSAPIAPPIVTPPAPNFPPPPIPIRAGGTAAPAASASPAPSTPAAPAEHYAPPPHGAQYDVPPPPGAARVPGPSLALPAAALVSVPPPRALVAAATPIASPADFGALPRTSIAGEVEPSVAPITIWTWLIAILPLLQFAIVYLAFGELGVVYAPGLQWVILIAPAVFGLVFANVDRRKLVDIGFTRAPSPLLAIVPPIYLFVRAFDVSRSSAIALVVWFLAQGVGVAGAIFLLPTVLSAATKSFF